MPSMDREIAALATGAGLTIADIGAAGGLQPRWRPFSGVISFLLFEPDARERPGDTGENIRVIPIGLAAQTGKLSLYLCRKPQVSSIFAPNREFLDRFPDADRYDITGTASIDAVTLDRWCAAEELRPDMIKIDTEGSEAEVLKGAVATLPETLGVEAEIAFQRLRKDQPLAEDVIAMLRGAGFELVDFLRLYRWGRRRHALFGQVTLADALFLRSPESVAERLGGMPPPAAATLARKYLVICAVYRLTDFFTTAAGLFANHLPEEDRPAVDALLSLLQKRERRLEFLLRAGWRVLARFGQMPLPFWNR